MLELLLQIGQRLSSNGFQVPNRILLPDQEEVVPLPVQVHSKLMPGQWQLQLQNEFDLAESQKPPGLPSIGADERVRIHILSGRACKTFVKLI